MLISHSERPRELRWYHAGPMLYGDWGTSRFYVLGLAFYYALHASFWYVAGVCSLVAAVGWAYTIICRCYPDGGGVYSAAKHTSRVLAVVGALLLFADYIITASLSALDGMHYFGISDRWVPLCAMGAIVLVGVVNYVGPKKAGTFALIVALATAALTVVLCVYSVPHLRQGWANIHAPTGSGSHQWLMLVNVVLALSGVEAIANMTGIMVPPVAKTSKKAIWPVLLEVVIFNLIFAVAMNALPNVPGVHISNEPGAVKDERQLVLAEATKTLAGPNVSPERRAAATAEKAAVEKEIAEHGAAEPTADDTQVKNAVLRFMGEKFIGHWFAVLSGGVFGLLLLSAVNTAVADMISIQYVMSRDTELPRFFTRLNVFGVPWVALLPAVLLPVVVLCFVTDLEKLADLYAIGVVGAIAINLGSCTANLTMPLKVVERVGMGVLAVIMVAIEGTLAYQKPHALYFAGAVLVIGLGLRFVTKTVLPARAKAAAGRDPAASYFRGQKIAGPSAVTADGTPAEALDMSKQKVLVATRGGLPLLNFAVKYAKRLDGILLVMFVRQINVIALGSPPAVSIDEDPEAKAVFERAAGLCAQAGVPMIPIYVVSPDVAYAILDHAATYNVESVLMGVSRQASFLRALRGDVLAAVADHLPSDIPLLIHA